MDAVTKQVNDTKSNMNLTIVRRTSNTNISTVNEADAWEDEWKTKD